MSELLKSLLAALAVALMVFAVVAMTINEYMVAGVSFLTASFVIFYRETRL